MTIHVPELPEVETIRRQLVGPVEGRTIVDAWAFPSAKFTPATDVIGRQIDEVARRGKFLLLMVADGVLAIHLGMTGRLSVVPDDIEAGAYRRASWSLDDGHRLDFDDVRRFGRVLAVSDVATAPGLLGQLGPEPFDPAFTPQALRHGLNRSRRARKTVLLDQKVVAGVGNIYADEALWQAGLHPGHRGRVSHAAAVALHTAIIDVLTQGIALGGTTLRDYVDAAGNSGRNQLQLRCYGRAGEPCERCGTVLRRRVIDARTTTFCGVCQR